MKEAIRVLVFAALATISLLLAGFMALGAAVVGAIVSTLAVIYLGFTLLESVGRALQGKRTLARAVVYFPAAIVGTALLVGLAFMAAIFGALVSAGVVFWLTTACLVGSARISIDGGSPQAQPLFAIAPGIRRRP